jgi:hypothetical protein
MHNPENSHVGYSPKNLVIAGAMAALGVALAAGGIYVGETDDAPGAALLGIGLGLTLVVFAVKRARRRA